VGNKNMEKIFEIITLAAIYHEHTREINIWNTVTCAGKQHSNIRVFGIYRMESFSLFNSSGEVLVDMAEKKGVIKCCSTYEAMTYIKMIYFGITKLCKCTGVKIPKISVSYLDLEIEDCSRVDLECETNKILCMEESEQRKRMLKKAKIESRDELLLLDRKLRRIEGLIESRSKSYLLSRVLNGSLKKSDISQYPDIIDATDTLIQINIITNRSINTRV
jgi:hypothetical protein